MYVDDRWTRTTHSHTSNNTQTHFTFESVFIFAYYETQAAAARDSDSIRIDPFLSLSSYIYIFIDSATLSMMLCRTHQPTDRSDLSIRCWKLGFNQTLCLTHTHTHNINISHFLWECLRSSHTASRCSPIHFNDVEGVHMHIFVVAQRGCVHIKVSTSNPFPSFQTKNHQIFVQYVCDIFLCRT